MTTNNDLLHIEAVRERGFILYAKDGELRAKKAPKFGTITLTYQDGKCVLLKTEETEK